MLSSVREVARRKFSEQAFLEDLCQSVCLLVEDGQQIGFTHRMFQEYFVAVYIGQAQDEIREELLRKYRRSIGSDNVVQLLYEMRPDLVERLYILPILTEIKDALRIKKKVSAKQSFLLLRMAFDEAELLMGRGSGMIVGWRSTHSSGEFWRLSFVEWVGRLVLKKPGRKGERRAAAAGEVMEMLDESGVVVEPTDKEVTVSLRHLKPESKLAEYLVGQWPGLGYLQDVCDYEPVLRKRLAREEGALDRILKRDR